VSAETIFVLRISHGLNSFSARRSKRRTVTIDKNTRGGINRKSHGDFAKPDIPTPLPPLLQPTEPFKVPSLPLGWRLVSFPGRGTKRLTALLDNHVEMKKNIRS
jgi:hypothetical protein